MSDNSVQANERYKTIVELAPDVVYTISKNGKLTSLSSAFEKLTGWERDEWIGKNFAGIVHPLDLPRALFNFTKTLKGETRTYYKLRIRKKKKGYIIGEFKSAPDIDENGKTVGVIGIGRDVTFEEEKEEELAYYKHIVQSTDSAVISRDLKGNITTWNKAAEKIFGYKSKEIIGKHFSILIPPENKKELEKIHRQIIRGEQIQDYETIRVNKLGRRIDVVAKISPIIDANKKIIGISAFDRDNTISKKEREYEKYIVRANKILFSSLSYSTTLKRVAKILVPEVADWCAVHIESRDELKRLVVAHEDERKIGLVERLQKKFESTSDKNTVSYKVFNSGKSILFKTIDYKMVQELVKNSEQRELIKQLNLRSAMIVPIISGKNILGVISLVSSNDDRHFTDQDLKFAEELGHLAGQAIENAKLYHQARVEINKRKKIEEDLRQSRDELSVILENIADGITLQDKNGKLVYVNKAAAKISGYKSPSEMLRNPAKWIDAYELKTENNEDYNLSMLPGRLALKGESTPQDVMLYVDKNTREEKWSVIKARPIKDSSGNVNAVVNIVSDVTQSKELERKKDDFISIASHELKTPITSIRGFIHLLEKKHMDYMDSKSYYYIKRMDRQLDKLTELVEDLLDLSRLQSGKLIYKREKFDLSKLIKEVIEDLDSTTDTHKVVFRNVINENVYGDRDRISQVVLNLVSNAIKYSPNGDKVLVSMKRDKEGVRVCVKDYGIGVEESEAKKIFDRFYRVKDTNDKTFPGLGIGLYISKEIIKRHNGKIWVTSKKKQGSTFQFTLPINSL